MYPPHICTQGGWAAGKLALFARLLMGTIGNSPEEPPGWEKSFTTGAYDSQGSRGSGLLSIVP